MAMEDRSTPDEILARLRSGDRIPQTDLARVAEMLADEHTQADTYTLIHILGRSGDRRYESLIAQYLESAADPMLARVAVIALSQWLGLAATYRDALIAFARGVPWDSEDDVKQVALSSLGEYLRTVDDDEVVAVLLACAENVRERDLLREDAVRALARGFGTPHSDMPPASQRDPLDSPWTSGVLVQARRAIGAQSSSPLVDPSV